MPRTPAEVPACYAMVQPGLEAIAAEEITRDLGGSVKKTDRGLIVFRVSDITPELLTLRTVEDVFLLAWGTDALTYRATDLDKIRRWTAHEPDWQRLLQLHHLVHPKPKGKPTYHLVCQMTGEHGYYRRDAGKALAEGLAGKFPASWKPVEENAAVEAWLTIHGNRAICGLRLSDHMMRHRDYKAEHRPASLRPSVAAAMVWLAGASPGNVVLDPMCGAGTILCEQVVIARQRKAGEVVVIGGDHDRDAVRAGAVNLRRVGPPPRLAKWDARRLPLPDQSVDRVITNPPFGKQLGDPVDIGPLYRRVVAECDRVLRPGGRAVFLVGEAGLLHPAAGAAGWRPQRQVRLRVLGQPAQISVWRKPEGGSTM
ncbi:MAG TPA: methyltransferase domain-containing protein [Gemmataceae bacterium]|nr:methyltransferase domain-containing protein [Gemmataceae bacterium]